MQHIWRKREVPTVFWWRYLAERDHPEDLSVDGRIISKYMFKKQDGKTQTALIWNKVGESGALLYTL